MKRLAGYFASLLSGIILTIVSAPAAAPAPVPAASQPADANMFLVHQHPWDEFWGGPASDKELMSVGYMICALHNRGLTQDQVFQETIAHNPPPGYVRDAAISRYSDALTYICP